MWSDKYEGSCRYNENVICERMDCGKCGWNPVISEKRLEDFRKKNGIQKKKPRERLIDAVSAAARIQMAIMPMVEKGVSQHRILAEVMKCISASRTADAETVIHCRNCRHAEESSDIRKKAGTLVCHNKQSPCNRRTVSKDFYCPCGEKPTDL